MCGDLNESLGCVCVCHGWYYSGTGRNGNSIVNGCDENTTWNIGTCWMTNMQYSACGERC